MECSIAEEEGTEANFFSCRAKIEGKVYTKSPRGYLSLSVSVGKKSMGLSHRLKI
jgi:hypothetical protein